MRKIVIKMEKNKIVIDHNGRINEYPRYRGFVQIAELLANPNYEISCLLLAANDMLKVWETEKRMERARLLYNPEDNRNNSYHSIDGYRGIEIMDEKYFNDLKKEANSLIARIAAAEEYNDIGKAEILKDELDKVTKYLLEMTRPGGKSKVLPDEFTKPLDALKKSVKKAIMMINENDPELSEHLQKQIRLSRYCCYHSLPSVEVSVTVTYNKHP